MIIETKDDFLTFFNAYKENPSVIIPVFLDNKRSIHNNSLCLLFIRILNKDDYYILPFNHSEADVLDYKTLSVLNNVNTKKYTLNKKQLLSVGITNNVIDISTLYYLNNNKIPEIENTYTNAELYILNQNEGHINIYSCVPLLKLSERLSDLSCKYQKIVNENENSETYESFSFLNDTTIENLYKIEKNGLFVDSAKLLEFFPNYNTHIDINNLIYSDYNVYTSTGRPSNRFGNLNFSALKKETGEREFLISRYGKDGMLVYFDYEAYHLTLAASLISYEFPSGISIHEYLGRQYFLKDTLTSDEYDKSKGISFEILYGGIDSTVAKEIPFFAKAKSYIDTMWKKYNDDGFILTNVSKKKIYSKNLDSMNCNKIFNYYLQNYETERNILIIDRINKLLEYKDTKLIMYLYDGFLFDYNKNDGKDLFLNIKNIMEDNGKFKTKQYAGKNFNNLNKIA